MNVIKNILGNKRFGGKNDLDFDGVPNRRDCQPRNTMRQDGNIIGYTKTGAVVKEESVGQYRGNGYFIYAKPGSIGKQISENQLNDVVVKKVNLNWWERFDSTR